MKIIKNLSKTVVKNYPDFHLREDLNFSDDGNCFRGFDYKGLPITTLRSDGRTYLDVRVDYLRDNDFTWEDWHNTEEYRLADEFNGCGEVDLDKLIDNCEKILVKIEELNAQAHSESLDMNPVRERMLKEITLIDTVIYEAQHNLKWWLLDNWDIRRAKDYIERLLQTKKRLSEAKLDCLSVKRKRELVQHLEEVGYIKVAEHTYEIESLREYIAKY